MGNKEKRRRSSVDEDKENKRIRKKIQRLEKKLNRQERHHEFSPFRSRSRVSTSRKRSSSRYSSDYSPSPHRVRSRSRYSSVSSEVRSVENYSSDGRLRAQDRTRSQSVSRHKSSSSREPVEIENNNLDNQESRKDDTAQATDVPAIETPDKGAPEVVSTQLPGVITQEVPDHEIELQEEVVNVIGPRLDLGKKTAAAVHKDIALRWSEIIMKGLPPEEQKLLLDKYPIPDNCNFLLVPKINAEITASLQESAVKRDKRIVEKQERVAACLGAIGKAISITLKTNSSEKLELLENLSDGGRLLASIHRDESLARKSIIMANLNVSMKSTLSNTSVDEWLFGGDLEEKIKLAQSIEKTTKVLKPPSKYTQQRNIQKNIQQNSKNMKGPPRQQIYKNQTSTTGGQQKRTPNRQRSTYSSSEPRKSSYRREPTRDRYRRRH